MDRIPKPNNLKVIGSGLGKTGTLSLRMALLELGLGPCYHGYELLKADYVDQNNLQISGHSNLSDTPTWIQAMQAKNAYDSDPETQADQLVKCCQILDDLLKNYNSAVDWPVAYFYKELSLMHPDAIIIETVRDSEEIWADSFLKTLAHWFFMEIDPENQFQVMNAMLIHRPEDMTQVPDQKQFLIDLMRKHQLELESNLAPGRYFKFNAKSGWENKNWVEKIWPIMDQEKFTIPVGQKFPHWNDTKSFNLRSQTVAKHQGC